MFNNALVTVLMSVYNCRQTISRTIDSILNQTFENFEFLIIDDCSDDDTYSVIKGYNDKRIRLIRNEKNLGLTKSLNYGLAKSNGKYIARIDGDDFSSPERLEKQVLFLKSNMDFVLIGTSYNILDSNYNVVKTVNYSFSPEKLFYDLIFQNMLAHSSAMFLKEKVLKVGGYNENYFYAQDYDLWSRLSFLGKIYVLPEVLTSWVNKANNISSMNFEQQNEVSFEIFQQNLRRFNLEEKLIYSALYFHNFYDYNYLKIPDKIFYETLKNFLKINDYIIQYAPYFYNKDILSAEILSTFLEILKNFYKKRSKTKVINFLIKNIFNYKITGAIFSKLLKKFKL